MTHARTKSGKGPMTPTPRKAGPRKVPKPLKAFAVVDETGRHLAMSTLTHAVAWYAKDDARTLCGMTEDVIRVTIVPDVASAAPDLAAVNKRLRDLLVEFREMFTAEVGIDFDKCGTPAKKRACLWRKEHRLRDRIDKALSPRGGRGGRRR